MPHESIKRAAPTPPAPPAPLATSDNEVEDVLLAIAPYYVLLLATLVVVAGAIIAAIIWPNWYHALLGSFSGSEPKAYWYLARASAFAAYGLLWSSMALGLAITNKLARLWQGGPTVAALHDYTSVLGLGFGIFHALVLTGDRYTDYTLAQVLVPFASVNYRPIWVGLGQIGLYVMALVTVSFYVRRWIGYRTWRVIHAASFGVFLLALVHGIMSGTDSGTHVAQLMYWASGISLAALTMQRIARVRPPAAAMRERNPARR